MAHAQNGFEDNKVSAVKKRGDSVIYRLKAGNAESRPSGSALPENLKTGSTADKYNQPFDSFKKWTRDEFPRWYRRIERLIQSVT